MKVSSKTLPVKLLAAIVGLAAGLAVQAQPTGVLSSATGPWSNGRWLVQTSLYTTHFSPNPEHVNQQNLINLEYWRQDRWLVGGALFRNSFGQPSQYIYLGKYWRPFDFSQNIHLKLTGGLLHGYKDQYRDKIPFNQAGVAPVILPSLGYSTKRLNAEMILFGNSGLMLTAGVFFD
jgi:hypothetical protein